MAPGPGPDMLGVGGLDEDPWEGVTWVLAVRPQGAEARVGQSPELILLEGPAQLRQEVLQGDALWGGAGGGATFSVWAPQRDARRKATGQGPPQTRGVCPTQCTPGRTGWESPHVSTAGAGGARGETSTCARPVGA